MSDRDFPFTKGNDPGVGAYTAMVITCGQCGVKSTFKQSSGSRMPGIAAAQYFRRHGWLVASKSKDDRCPSHAVRRKEIAPVVKSTTPTPAPEPPKVEPPPKADMPKVMSREDKRLVFTSIAEVWDDNIGYLDMATDASVAAGIGVPVAWVTQVRDDMFGPIPEANPLNKLVEEGEALLQEVKAKVTEARAILAALAAFDVRVNSLERQLADIRKAQRGMK